jgi:hypothetical protein
LRRAFSSFYHGVTISATDDQQLGLYRGDGGIDRAEQRQRATINAGADAAQGGIARVRKNNPCKASLLARAVVAAGRQTDSDAVGCWIGYLASLVNALIARIRPEN